MKDKYWFCKECCGGAQTFHLPASWIVCETCHDYAYGLFTYEDGAYNAAVIFSIHEHS